MSTPKRAPGRPKTADRSHVQSHQITIRLTPKMIARLKRAMVYLKRRSLDRATNVWTRAATLRLLVDVGLDSLDEKKRAAP